MDRLAIAALIFFAPGWLLGPLVTGFWLPTPAQWWAPALVRVAWQLGGPLLLAVGMLVRGGDRGGWAVTAALTAIGALLCCNPLLDLAGGPERLRGRAEVEVRDGKHIFADITVTAADGSVVEVDLSGWRVEVWLAELRACDGAAIDMTVLRHTGVVLELSCEPQR